MGRAVAAILATLLQTDKHDWEQLFQQHFLDNDQLLASRETQPELDDLLFLIDTHDQVQVRRLSQRLTTLAINWQTSFMLNLMVRLSCWLRVTVGQSQGGSVSVVRQWGRKVFASPFHPSGTPTWPFMHWAVGDNLIEIRESQLLAVELVMFWNNAEQEVLVASPGLHAFRRDLIFQGAVNFEQLVGGLSGKRDLLLLGPTGNGRVIMKPLGRDHWWQRVRPVKILCLQMEAVEVPAEWLWEQMLINARLIRKDGLDLDNQAELTTP